MLVTCQWDLAVIKFSDNILSIVGLIFLVLLNKLNTKGYRNQALKSFGNKTQTSFAIVDIKIVQITTKHKTLLRFEASD